MLASLRLSRVSFAVLCAVVVALVWGAVPAAAHTELTAANPEEGATVEVLDEVRLDFSSALLEIGAELELVDAVGDTHVLTPEFLSDAHAVVATVDPSALPAGQTMLNWRIVAEDGHPIEGVITFTYAPSFAPEDPDGAEDPDVADPEIGVGTETPQEGVDADAQSSPNATVETQGGVLEDADSESVAPWIWVIAGLAVIGVAGAAIVMAGRRGESLDEPRSDGQP